MKRKTKKVYKNMRKLHRILYESTRHLDHHHRTMDKLKLEDNEQYMTMMYNHVYWGLRLRDRYDGRFNQDSVYDALMRITYYDVVRDLRKEIYYTNLILGG